MIIQRIVLRSTIQCLTPFHLGSGSGENTDMDILSDENDIPVITASGFIGALKGAIRLDPNIETSKKKQLDEFWGFADNEDGHESSVWCPDLICKTENPVVVVRDGIEIDDVNCRPREQSKYDFELVERNTRFDFEMTFDCRNVEDVDFVKQMAHTLYDILENSRVQIGAMTSNGLGKIRIDPTDTRIYCYDFAKKQDVFDWLASGDEPSVTRLIKPEDLGDHFAVANPFVFSIEADFRLKNSMIIRASDKDPKKPDAVHIRTLGRAIIPGKSAKGAIRSRAKKILRTLGKPLSILNDLFGYVSDSQRGNDKKKGKVTVSESLLPDYVAELQTRITINRLTQGTIKTRLFDSMPIFSRLNTGENIVKLELRAKDISKAQAGLLLLVLKDLWTGDLALGGEKGIGRGVLEGIRAVIKYEDNTYVIEGDILGVDQKVKDKLNEFVKELEKAV
jgi:CRISPR/Cas system CSM-associated protein Csm3 (group 7 of RAMP superfamily)